jgi:hypothetical protein
MSNPNQRTMIGYTFAAGLVLTIGALISVTNEPGSAGTWWLLLLAALAWFQSTLLRREIRTSGRMLLLFVVSSWALLGFALVSLLPPVAPRILGDLVVLLVIAAFTWPRTRSAR